MYEGLRRLVRIRELAQTLHTLRQFSMDGRYVQNVVVTHVDHMHFVVAPVATDILRIIRMSSASKLLDPV